MPAIKLYATKERVNGHEAVGVSDGGPDEASWRELGYVPEDELPKREKAPQKAANEPVSEPEPVQEPEPAVEPEKPKRGPGRPRKSKG